MSTILDQFTKEQLAEITAALAPVEPKTKTAKEVFDPIKDAMVKEYRRLDKLIKAYFRLGCHTDLYNDIGYVKAYNSEIGNMFFSFDENDIGKLSSLLAQIFKLDYFKTPTTPKQFVNELRTLLTAKDEKKRSFTLSFNRVECTDFAKYGIGNIRPAKYKVKAKYSFDQSTVVGIFEAYMS